MMIGGKRLILVFSVTGLNHDQGKLTKAAEKLEISIRQTLWNMLKTWKIFFGSDIVELHKARAAKLTSLRWKLLGPEQFGWTARVLNAINFKSGGAPKIWVKFGDKKEYKLQRAMFKNRGSLVMAVALLPDSTNKLNKFAIQKPPKSLTCRFQKGRCDIAAFHLPTDYPLISHWLHMHK